MLNWSPGQIEMARDVALLLAESIGALNISDGGRKSYASKSNAESRERINAECNAEVPFVN